MTPVSGLGIVCFGICLFAVHGAGGWADCDAKPSTADGAYSHTFLSTVNDGVQFWMQYPTGALPQGQNGWPVVIFMHALNLGWEWYQPQVERLASHGFFVVFPFIKSASADDHVTPIVADYKGTNLKQALDFVRAISSGKEAVPHGLQGNLDLSNMAWVGHNMGGASAIRDAAALPQGTVKLVVAMHPFICDLGPPPYPFTISSKEIKQASNNAGLLFFTSENDDAFLKGTPEREETCFKNAQGDAIFANFKGSVCDAYPDCKDMPENGPYGKLDCKAKFHAFGKGHFCPCSAPMPSKWVSPEEQWVTTAVRAFLQHGIGASSSVCGSSLWGVGPGSLSSDGNIASKIIQRKSDANIVI